MARGLEKHQARQNALSLLGKDLTRRSGACCELCETSGVALAAYEIPPVPVDPDYENCLFLCEACRGQLAKPAKMSPGHWRGLVSVIWSEVPAVQVMAARILERLSRDHEWAREILDEAYFDESIEERVEAERL